jgi:hypothetical protein
VHRDAGGFPRDPGWSRAALDREITLWLICDAARRSSRRFDSSPRSQLTPFRDIDLAAVYTTAEIAAIMRVTEDKVRRWCRAGRLAPLPSVCASGPYRVLGSEVPKLLGGQRPVPTKPTETISERNRRAAETLDRIRTLASSPRPR